MKLSPDRQNHLANIILENLLKQDFVESPSRELLFEKIKQALLLFEKEWEEMDQEISHKISSIKRGVHPGSSEWDVLYSRFLEESFRKKSRLFVKK